MAGHADLRSEWRYPGAADHADSNIPPIQCGGMAAQLRGWDATAVTPPSLQPLGPQQICPGPALGHHPSSYPPFLPALCGFPGAYFFHPLSFMSAASAVPFLGPCSQPCESSNSNTMTAHPERGHPPQHTGPPRELQAVVPPAVLLYRGDASSRSSLESSCRTTVGPTAAEDGQLEPSSQSAGDDVRPVSCNNPGAAGPSRPAALGSLCCSEVTLALGGPVVDALAVAPSAAPLTWPPWGNAPGLDVPAAAALAAAAAWNAASGQGLTAANGSFNLGHLSVQAAPDRVPAASGAMQWPASAGFVGPCGLIGYGSYYPAAACTVARTDRGGDFGRGANGGCGAICAAAMEWAGASGSGGCGGSQVPILGCRVGIPRAPSSCPASAPATIAPASTAACALAAAAGPLTIASFGSTSAEVGGADPGAEAGRRAVQDGHLPLDAAVTVGDSLPGGRSDECAELAARGAGEEGRQLDCCGGPEAQHQQQQQRKRPRSEQEAGDAGYTNSLFSDLPFNIRLNGSLGLESGSLQRADAAGAFCRGALLGPAFEADRAQAAGAAGVAPSTWPGLLAGRAAAAEAPAPVGMAVPAPAAAAAAAAAALSAGTAMAGAPAQAGATASAATAAGTAAVVLPGCSELDSASLAALAAELQAVLAEETGALSPEEDDEDEDANGTSTCPVDATQLS